MRAACAHAATAAGMPRADALVLGPPTPASPQATFFALAATYGFLTPELWRETVFTKSPMQEYSDFLAKPVSRQPGRHPPVCCWAGRQWP